MQDPPWELLSSPITQTSPANAQREKFQFFSGNADGSHSPYMTSGSASAYNLSTPMVSHSYSAEPPRRPPSVSSRSTTTRRHRNHRSHHGGSSYAPQNEFPNFANTGDVEIIVNHEGQEKRYMLHRLILAQCSGFFEASTSEEWSRAQAQSLIQGAAQGPDRALGRIGEEEETGGPSRRPGPVPHAGHRPRWRYELDSETQEDEVPMLIQKPPPSTLFGGEHPSRPPPVRNKPAAPSNGFFRSMSAIQSAIHITPSAAKNEPDNYVLRDYDNLFRIFYNYPPALDPVNITEAYIQCKTLLALADMYDALEVVGPRIDHHLLQYQSRLWKQIAKYPPSYLRLGYLARSKVIFAEALIHVVGQWPIGSPQLHGLPESIMELIEDKVEEMEDLKAKIEGRLLRLSLKTPGRGDRVNPYNDPLGWLANSLFRDWVAENTADSRPAKPKADAPLNWYEQARNSHSMPNIGRTYRLLGTGGSSYLNHDELKRFLKRRPDDYSRENLKLFEMRMNELKRSATDLVKPVLRNCLELDLGRDGGGLGYLTCTRVEDADFPWD